MYTSPSVPLRVEGSMLAVLTLLPLEQATQGKEGNMFSYRAFATRFIDSVLGGP